MVSAPPKPRPKRPTRKLPRPDAPGKVEARGGDRWITLSTGESALIHPDGSIWCHRVDREHPSVNKWGNKAYPVMDIMVGRISDMTPQEVEGLGLESLAKQLSRKSGKSEGGTDIPETCTEAFLDASESLPDGQETHTLGRPRTEISDRALLEWSAQGWGIRRMASELEARGIKISKSTIAGRLKEFRE